jgi:predicted HicB family RNase H-like nuclease
MRGQSRTAPDRNASRLNLALPVKLHDALVEAARSKAISLNSLVRMVCTEALAKNSNDVQRRA